MTPESDVTTELRPRRVWVEEAAILLTVKPGKRKCDVQLKIRHCLTDYEDDGRKDRRDDTFEGQTNMLFYYFSDSDCEVEVSENQFTVAQDNKRYTLKLFQHSAVPTYSCV